jgi:hypothetical protein
MITSAKRFDGSTNCMHWPHRRDVLIDYRIKCAPALGDVAAQAAYEAKVVRRIDKSL